MTPPETPRNSLLTMSAPLAPSRLIAVVPPRKTQSPTVTDRDREISIRPSWKLKPLTTVSGPRATISPMTVAPSGAYRVTPGGTSRREIRYSPGSTTTVVPGSARPTACSRRERKSGEKGKSVSVRVDHGGRRRIQKKKKQIYKKNYKL